MQSRIAFAAHRTKVMDENMTAATGHRKRKGVMLTISSSGLTEEELLQIANDLEPLR